MGKKTAKGFYFLIILSGLFLSCYGFYTVIDASRCRKWEVVPGRIMDSFFVESSDIHKSRIGKTFIPDIKYEYSYRGETKFNNQVGYFGRDLQGLSQSFYEGSEKDVMDFLKTYPLDSNVDVYVNPEDSSQSVLDTGLKFPMFMPLLYGFFMVLLGIHLHVFGAFYAADNKNIGKLS